MSEVKGTCALCKKENVILEESHIIPKFVVRRIKKKSITGFIRNLFNPNSVMQDSEKEYLLCGECEDRFSVAETLFANTVFHPFKDKKISTFDYDVWLNYFIASVSWRILYLDIRDFEKDNDLEPGKLDYLKECEVVLRKFLLNEISSLKFENHIFFFDDIKEASAEIAQESPHTFFRHSTFGYTLISHDYDSFYVMSNLSGIILITILKKASIEEWSNTQILNGKNTFTIKNQIVKSSSLSDLLNYMKECNQNKSKISEKQQTQILERVKRNNDKLQHSEYLENHIKDKGIE